MNRFFMRPRPSSPPFLKYCRLCNLSTPTAISMPPNSATARPRLVAAARAAGVEAHRRPRGGARQFRRRARPVRTHSRLRARLGIHPMYVDEAQPEDLDALRDYLAQHATGRDRRNRAGFFRRTSRSRAAGILFRRTAQNRARIRSAGAAAYPPRAGHHSQASAPAPECAAASPTPSTAAASRRRNSSSSASSSASAAP